MTDGSDRYDIQYTEGSPYNDHASHWWKMTLFGMMMSLVTGLTIAVVLLHLTPLEVCL